MAKTAQTHKNFRYNGKRVAVLSDIHSNACALEACLADAQAEGADCYIFLGDYISGLAAPVETMDLVYATQKRYPTFCIRGNRERYILDHRNGTQVCEEGSNTGSFLFTSNQLRDEDIAFFESLPIFDVIEVGGVTLEVAHATQNNDRYYFEKGDSKISGVVHQMKAQYLLCGHSHKQFQYNEGNKAVINPGSVGLPQGSDHRAQYLLLDIADGSVHCRFRQVDYDVKNMIHQQFQSGLVGMGRCWAISDLYGALTGEEYTKMLLTEMYKHETPATIAAADEQLWEHCAAGLGMRFTEEEILAAFP